MDFAVGQEMVFVDCPRVGVIAAHLNEVEPIGRVDSGTCADEPVLEFSVFSLGPLREWVLDEEFPASHQRRAHDEVGVAVLSFREPAHDDIASSEVQVMGLFPDEVRIGVPQCGQLIGQVMGTVDVVIIHFRHDRSRACGNSAVETCAEWFVCFYMDDREILNPSVSSLGCQVVRSFEAVSHQD